MQIGSFIIFIAIVLVICSVDLSHNSLDKPTELLLYDTRDDNETLTNTENSVNNSNTQSSLSDVDLAAWSDTTGNSSEEFSPDLVEPSAAELKQADEVVAQQAMAELNKQQILKSNKSSTKKKNIDVRNLDIPIDETIVKANTSEASSAAASKASSAAASKASSTRANVNKAATTSDFEALQNSLAGRKPSYAGSIANAAEEFMKMANTVSSETSESSPSSNNRRRESKPGRRSGNVLHQNASAKSTDSMQSQRLHNKTNVKADAGEGSNFSSDFRSDDFNHVGIATDFDDFSSDDISASDDLLGEIYNNTNR